MTFASVKVPSAAVRMLCPAMVTVTLDIGTLFTATTVPVTVIGVGTVMVMVTGRAVRAPAVAWSVAVV